jgi:hypothetical protein
MIRRFKKRDKATIEEVISMPTLPPSLPPTMEEKTMIQHKPPESGADGTVIFG